MWVRANYFIHATSVRFLPNIVAGGIIVARHEPCTIIALNSCTTKVNRIVPNYLSIMATHLFWSTSVQIKIVICLLTNPQVHSIYTGEVKPWPRGKILAPTDSHHVFDWHSFVQNWLHGYPMSWALHQPELGLDYEHQHSLVASFGLGKY